MSSFAILGAGGFIGYRLTEYLLLNDLAVPRPIVRRFHSMARVSRFNLDIRIADALDVNALAAAVNGCEVLFHSVVGGKETIVNSIEATYSACRIAGVRRMVYLSSAVVHSHNPVPGSDESSSLIIDQPFEYNVNKVLAEQKLLAMMADRSVECVILRPSIVFGPRSTYWTGEIASDMLAGKAYLVEDGKGICNTIFVDNLVEVMSLCANHPAANGEVFLVKDVERVTWRELYTSVAEAIGVNPASIPLISSGTEAGLQSLDPGMVSLQKCQYELPFRKLSERLGYIPTVSFKEAARRTADWLRFAFGGMQ